MIQQLTFFVKLQVNNLCNVIRRMGNPFLDHFPELVILDSRECADSSVADTLCRLESIGKEQYKSYVEDVVTKRSRSIHDTIKKNSLPLLRTRSIKKSTNQAQKIAQLKNNAALFAQLYVAMQSREMDMREFFSHEVHSFPPSLSESGNLRLPSAKSDLLKFLRHPERSPPTSFECRILDGAVLVHSLPTITATTFDDYADSVFIPHLIQQLQFSKRIDVVWDAYIPNSLKETTREKRGQGVRRKVSGHVKLPKNWMQFLRDPANKSELFAFLTSKVAEFKWPHDRCVNITCGKL